MAQGTYHHVGLVCKDPIAIEQWYGKHFGFERARVVMPGSGQVVFIKSGNVYLELFQATQDAPTPAPGGAGPEHPGWRHLAFKVDSVSAKLADMGDGARVTLGPLDFSSVIPGWHTAWVADPEGNIVEISEGYVDEENPPSAP